MTSPYDRGSTAAAVRRGGVGSPAVKALTSLAPVRSSPTIQTLESDHAATPVKKVVVARAGRMEACHAAPFLAVPVQDQRPPLLRQPLT